MIACFLSNIYAKYYKNPSMLSRVIAKNVGDVFLRHSVQHTYLVNISSHKINPHSTDMVTYLFKTVLAIVWTKLYYARTVR